VDNSVRSVSSVVRRLDFMYDDAKEIEVDGAEERDVDGDPNCPCSRSSSATRNAHA
jgi:hypothetical protein